MLARLKTAFRDRKNTWRERLSADLAAPENRRRAYIDMMMFDHGILRLWWRNLDEIAPGVWRSNQPSPAQIAQLARRGIRTIINLRGPSNAGSYHLERETCAALGIGLVDRRLYSAIPPTPEEVEDLFEVFATAERPLLMHCKSGADRAGIGAALYLIWAGHPPEEALRQLSMRYLHNKRARTGVLDRFIESYANARRKSGIAFVDWLRSGYDREAVMAGHVSNPIHNLIIDRVLNRE